MMNYEIDRDSIINTRFRTLISKSPKDIPQNLSKT